MRNKERERIGERERENMGAAAPLLKAWHSQAVATRHGRTAKAPGATDAGQGWPAATPKEEEKGRVVGFWMVVMMVSYGGGGYGGFKEEKNFEMVRGERGDRRFAGSSPEGQRAQGYGGGR